MAESIIKNPLNPIELQTSINSLGATGTLSAYKIGRLVIVIGAISPTLTGTNLTLATVYGARAVSTGRMIAQVGGYNNASQEVYFDPLGNDTQLKFNITAISDLKINACFICE